MIIPSLSSLLALAICVLAAPSPRTNHVFHEKRALEPVDWINVGRLQPNHVLPMRFGLTQQNLHLVDEILMAISHPDSPTFGSHMSAAEVNEAFAPSRETLHSVVDWLAAAGISKERLRLTHNQAWVEVNATTAEVEELLHTEYHLYVHAETGAEQIGCHSYSVPAHISEHIDLVRPTVHFKHTPPARPAGNSLKKRFSMHLATQHSRPSSNLAAAANTSSALDKCSQMITPDCLRALYNIKYTPTQSANNSYGIAEFNDDSYEPTDLDLFYKKYAPSLVNSRPNLVAIDGGGLVANVTAVGHDESDLDIQYASVLVAPLRLTLLEVGKGGGFDDWLDAVDGSFCTFEGGDGSNQGDSSLPVNAQTCGVVSPPYVVSVSWGGSEVEQTGKYLERQCTEYAKLGMMGSSILYSSGDNGVAAGGDKCINIADRSQTSNGTGFNPQFPVTCPYITAVGATQMVNGSTVADPEVACQTVIRSGGGFSNYFAMPSYQTSYVQSYLRANPPPYNASVYNNSGTTRGYPDLAANGAFYDVAITGSFEPIFGTSASSPVVGSLIALINDARLAAGKKPVGFLNPIIYSDSFQAGFNDIVSGSNPGCGTKGFTAAKGWDPVTGLRTLNLETLGPLFLALP
ncbi:hypothetical protein HWV62_11730 [Athelia sp. TMB]|nr:hypothetical protein HWV62_11730 [Athelia sp. TMB]